MDFADFGRYLCQQRELRGLSRDEVAQTTRIPRRVIEALEEGALAQLPGRVFVLNYIRAYAQVIGLAPEEALLRFQEIDQTLKSAPPPVALERARRRKAWGVLAVLVLVVVVCAFAAVWWMHGSHSPRG